MAERVRQPAVQDFYPDGFAWCYGCGRLNEQGLHFKTRWDGDETITVYTPRPEHIAVPGFVYGGLIASLIDCHSMGTAALAHYRRAGHVLGDPGAPEVPRFVTASLKVDYLRPTPLGPELIVRGRIAEMGERKVIVHSELFAEGELCCRGEVVAVLAPPHMVRE